MRSTALTAIATAAFGILLLATGPAAAGTLGAIHPGGGFEDAKLGDPIESFTGLELIGRDPEAGTETYVRRSDVLRIGGAGIDGVTYSFYGGRLYFISLRMTGKANAAAVLAALEAAFGPSSETGMHPNERIWPGGSRFVLYDFDRTTNRGMAAMTSTPIHARMHLDRSTPPAHLGQDF